MAKKIPTIAELIARSGGFRAVAEASDDTVSVQQAYKWPKIGIPDRYWPLIMRLSGATADELLQANIATRGPVRRKPDRASRTASVAA